MGVGETAADGAETDPATEALAEGGVEAEAAADAATEGERVISTPGAPTEGVSVDTAATAALAAACALRAALDGLPCPESMSIMSAMSDAAFDGLSPG